jgi:hypothetical protein
MAVSADNLAPVHLLDQLLQWSTVRDELADLAILLAYVIEFQNARIRLAAVEAWVRGQVCE